MFEELTPPTKIKRHNVFSKYFVMIISWIFSLVFIIVLATGAVFHHTKQLITGEERKHEPNAADRDAYPDVKKMKKSKDLRFYAVQLGLDLEEYKITTNDGYVLYLHRLIDPKVSVIERQALKPVLLQHGLLSCSGAYLSPGFSSLPYHLLKSGYDVWLGNNRSWFQPEHAYYENLWSSEEYWDYDVRELAYYDLPCIIDNVLAHKPQHDQLTLVGHLQGCTQSYLMLKNGNLKEHHRKVNLFVQLAPAIYPGVLFHEKSFLKFMHHRSRLGFQMWFGCCCFLRNLGRARNLLYNTKVFGNMSYIMFKYLFGWSGKNWNHKKKVWHFHFIFNVTFVSTKLMNWWLSEWVPEGFANQVLPKKAYHNGDNFAASPSDPSSKSGSSKSYFPFKEQWFSLEEDSVVVPMVVFSACADFLVDGKRLISHLRHFETKSYTEGQNLFIHEIPGYNHLDVIWADNIIDVAGKAIVERLTALYEQPATVTDSKEATEVEDDQTNEKTEKTPIVSNLPSSAAQKVAVE